MNGIHDLGGMHGFGPIVREDDALIFHDDWERQLYPLMRATLGWGYNIDEFRHAIERLPPDVYLNASYFERWFLAISTLLIEKGLISAEELEAGRAAQPGRSIDPGQVLTLERFRREVAIGRPTRWPEEGDKPRFRTQDAVIARNVHPAGHTRLPRYLRGKTGTIHRVYGRYILPDSHAHGLGALRQHLYNVRFEAATLWGPDAQGPGAVYADLWESYLDPA